MIVRRRLTETQRPAERRWVGEGDYSDVGEHRWVDAGNMLWRKDDSWLREQNRNREKQREKTGMTLHIPAYDTRVRDDVTVVVVVVLLLRRLFGMSAAFWC